MKECDAGSARGKKRISFLSKCLIKKKIADRRKEEMHMKRTRLNEEYIRCLENRVSSLENKSSELEKIDKLIDVQNEIRIVLREECEIAHERKRKGIMERITNASLLWNRLYGAKYGSKS